jgi:hypothetical protein
MNYYDDPNPLDPEWPCSVKGCYGTWRLNEAGTVYACDACDFELPYEEVKRAGLFVLHTQDQTGLTNEEMAEALEEMDQEAEAIQNDGYLQYGRYWLVPEDKSGDPRNWSFKRFTVCCNKPDGETLRSVVATGLETLQDAQDWCDMH